jgi:multimeric flavodoxin WrbA
MNILVLNGSPRPSGSTSAMVNAFSEGAMENGHNVTVLPVCQKKITGCMGCEYCHTKSDGKCAQKDDMQDIYPLLQMSNMIVLASPIYYHNITGQLQCFISRLYALGIIKNLTKSALILSSGSDNVYSGAINQYRRSFTSYMKMEDMGIFTAFGKQNKSDEKLNELREFGRSLH